MIPTFGLPQRDPEVGPNPAQLDAGNGQGKAIAVGGGRREVFDLKKGPISGSAAHYLLKRSRLTSQELAIRLGEVTYGDSASDIAIDGPKAAEGRVAEPYRDFRDRIERSSEVSG
jgi:hypothetical protein